MLAKKAEMNMKAGVTLSRNQERVHVDERIARKLVTSKDTVNKARQLINSKLFKEDEFFREEVRADTLRINPAHQQMRRGQKTETSPSLHPRRENTISST